VSNFTEYLSKWQFWFAVVAVAVIVNYAYQKLMPGKGKLA
jgi:hypothetical protein